MTDVTPRLGLPLLAAGQAQKEISHNEALVLIDAMAQPVAETIGDTVPPTAPAIGQAWIVGAAPVGDWSGRAGAIALWTAGGWRFVAAREGMTIWVRAPGLHARRTATAWTTGQLAASALLIGGVQVVGTQRPAIAAPTGGGAVDAEARATIQAMLTALRGHGLIAG